MKMKINLLRLKDIFPILPSFTALWLWLSFSSFNWCDVFFKL